MGVAVEYGVDAEAGMKLAKLMRERRLELGLTQPQVAAAVGWSVPQVSRMENGAIFFLPAPRRVAKLAKVLRLPQTTVIRAFGYMGGLRDGRGQRGAAVPD